MHKYITSFQEVVSAVKKNNTEENRGQGVAILGGREMEGCSEEGIYGQRPD